MFESGSVVYISDIYLQILEDVSDETDSVQMSRPNNFLFLSDTITDIGLGRL